MIGATAERVAERRRDGVWPRVYRIRRGQRLFVGGFGVVAILGGLAGAGAVLLGSSDAPLALVLLAFVALGAYLVAAVATERLVLYEDAIEFRELGRGTRRARRDEIAGLRVVPLQYGYRQLVFERRGGKKPLKITWVHETDAVLQAWIDAIPNLDAEERARAEAELLRSTALGADEAERARALGRARKIARVLNGAAIAASAWGWIYPRPYDAAVVVLGVFPLVGLALLFAGRGRYGYDTRRNDPRPTLVPAVMVPGLILGLRALVDVNLVDWKPLVLGAAVAGLAFTAALTVSVARGERSRKLWVVALILFPLHASYPWGALTLANAMLDHGAPEVFPVTVRGKHVSSGKHTSWDLDLDPWGPVAERKSVDVGRRLYGLVSVGDRVCVVLRPGALGARWYGVVRCRDGRAR